MNKLPYIFFGSPPIGPIALAALNEAHYPPALVISDKSLSLEEMTEQIEAVNPTFYLVVGFGAILKRPILDLVAGQVLNIHPSLLPLYRGPAPVVQTILDGALETGVTLMEIDEKMDHGPILGQDQMPLRGDETPDDLYRVLTIKGVQLFLEQIDGYLNETIEGEPQNHFDATITHFVKKQDGLLDLDEPVEFSERKVRAYQGWPGAFIYANGKRLIIHKAHIQEGELRFGEVQPENGKRMALAAYLAGQRLSEEDFYASLSSIAPEKEAEL